MMQMDTSPRPIPWPAQAAELAARLPCPRRYGRTGRCHGHLQPTEYLGRGVQRDMHRWAVQCDRCGRRSCLELDAALVGPVPGQFWHD
jgi:hypothetical protein